MEDDTEFHLENKIDLRQHIVTWGLYKIILFKRGESTNQCVCTGFHSWFVPVCS